MKDKRKIFHKLKQFFLFLGFCFLYLGASEIYPQEKITKEKVYQYRKNQVVDLSGSMVSGKIRTPEIFYIFQRKRSTGQDFVTVPDNLKNHQDESMNRLRGALLP